MALILIVIFLLYSIPGWHEELDEDGEAIDVKNFTTMAVLHPAVTLSILACFLGLLSVLWQHIASVVLTTSVEDTAYGKVKGSLGLPSLVLGWMAVAATGIGAVGVVLIAIATTMVDGSTDD